MTRPWTCRSTTWSTNSSTSAPSCFDLSGTGTHGCFRWRLASHKGIRGNRLAAFDMDANSVPIVMEWVGPKAGLLVEPRPDGTVDGNCLFGTTGGYENGFEKLALRDSNRDGVLTGAELKALRVWIDENGNGKAEPGELRSLESLGSQPSVFVTTRRPSRAASP